MAISDKVIDLAPVNKTKNVIFIVIMAVLAAVAGTFVTLYALKPNVTVQTVKSVTLSANLFEQGEDELLASLNNAYVFTAEVGADAGANTKVNWIYPSSYLREEPLSESEIPANPNFSRIKLRVAPNAPDGQELNVQAVADGDSKKLSEIKFKVKIGGASEVRIDGLTDTAGNPYNIKDGSPTLPFISSVSKRATYTVAASQSGFKNAAGEELSITENITSSIDRNKYFDTLSCEALLVTYDAEGRELSADAEAGAAIIRLDPPLPDAEFFSFQVISDGKAQGLDNSLKKAVIRITANKYNSSPEVSEEIALKVLTAEEMGIISRYGYFQEPVGPDVTEVYWGDSVNKAELSYSGTQKFFNLQEHIAVDPTALRQKNWFKNCKIDTSDKNVAQPMNDASNNRGLAIKSAGIVTVTITDTTPVENGGNIGASFNLTLVVNLQLGELKAYYEDATKPIFSSNKGEAAEAEIEVYRGQSSVGSETTGSPLKLEYRFQTTALDANFAKLDLYAEVWNEEAGIFNKLKANDPSVSFGDRYNERTGIISVSGSLKTGSGPWMDAVVDFGIGVSADSVKLRLTPVSDVFGTAGITFILNLKVVETAKSFNFNYGYKFDPNLDPYVTFGPKDDGSGNAQLTLQLRNSTYRSGFKLSDLLNYLNAASEIDESARTLGIKNTSLTFAPGLTNHITMLTPGTVETSVRPERETTGDNKGKYYIELKLSKTDNTTVSKRLYINVIDTPTEISGELASGVSPTINYKLGQISGGISTNSINNKLTQNFFSGAKRTGLTGTYITPNFNIDVQLGGEMLCKKRISGTFYYFLSPSLAKEGTAADAVFSMNNGEVKILKDLYVLGREAGKEYGSFYIVYTTRNGDEPENGDGFIEPNQNPEYNFKLEYVPVRLIDEMRLFDSSLYNPDGEIAPDGDRYKLTQNHMTSSFSLYPAGIVYKNEEKTDYYVIGIKQGNSDPKVEEFLAPSISDGSLLKLNSDGTFMTEELPVGAEEKTVNVIFSCKTSGTALTVELLIQNKARPIESIKLYSDAERNHEIASGTTAVISAYTVGALRDSLTFYYTVNYSAAAGSYTSYDVIRFTSSGNLLLFYDVSDDSSPITGKTFTYPSVWNSASAVKEGGIIIKSAGETSSNKVSNIKILSGMTDAVTGSPVESVSVEALIAAPASDAYLKNASGVKYTQNSVNTLEFHIGQNGGTPVADYIDLTLGTDSFASGYVCDPENFTLSVVAFDKVAVSPLSGVKGFRISTVGQVGEASFTVLITEKIGDYENVRTLNFTAKITCEIYSLKVNSGDPVKAVTTGEASDGTLSVPVSVEVNGGSALLIPDEVPALKITNAAGTEVLTHTGVALDGFTLKIDNKLLELTKTLYLTAFSENGVASLPARIDFSTQKVTLAFENKPESLTDASKTYDFAATLRNAGTGIAYVAGTYEGVISYTSSNPSAASITSDGKVTLLKKAAASVTFTASYALAGEEKAAASVVVSVNNRIAGFELIKDFDHQVDGNRAIWIMKGGTLDLAEYVKAVSPNSSIEPYTSVYSVSSSEVSVLSVSGEVLSARKEGSSVITIFADNAEAGGVAAVSFTVTVNVVMPGAAAAIDRENINLFSADSRVFTVTPSLPAGYAADNGDFTLEFKNPSDSALFTLNGYTVTLNDAAFTDPAYLKTYTFVVFAYIDGIKTLNAEIKLNVTATVQIGLTVEKSDGTTVSNNTLIVGENYKAAASVSPSAPAAITTNLSSVTVGADGSFTPDTTGTLTLTAAVTGFGVTIYKNVSLIVADDSKVAFGLYDAPGGNVLSGSAAVDFDSENAPDNRYAFYAVADVSGVNYSGFSAASFTVSVSSNAVIADGTGVYDAANKRFYQKFKARRAAENVNFTLTVTMVGRPVKTLDTEFDFTAAAPDFTVKASAAAADPGQTLTLSFAKSAAASAFKGAVTASYSVSVGDSLVEASSFTGANADKLILKTNTAGGKVTVKATLTVSSGAYSGTELVRYVDITVNTLPAPSVSPKAGTVFVKAGEKVNLAASFDLASVSGAGYNLVYSLADGYQNFGTFSNDVFTANSVSGGGKVKATAALNIVSGPFAGRACTADFFIMIDPVLEFAASSYTVTAGGTVALPLKTNGHESEMGNIGYSLAFGTLGSVTASAASGEDAVFASVYSKGGRVAVTAAVVLGGGEFAGRTLTATAEILVYGLTVPDVTAASGGSVTPSLTPYGGEAVTSGVTYTGENESALPPFVTVNGAELKIAAGTVVKDDSDAAANLTVTLTAAVVKDGITYKNSFKLTVTPQEKPGFTASVTQDGNDLSGTEFELVTGSVVLFNVSLSDSSSYVLTRVFLSSTDYGTSTGESNFARFAAADAADGKSEFKELILYAEVFGKIYTVASYKVKVIDPPAISDTEITPVGNAGGYAYNEIISYSSYDYTVTAPAYYYYAYFYYDRSVIDLKVTSLYPNNFNGNLSLSSFTGGSYLVIGNRTSTPVKINFRVTGSNVGATGLYIRFTGVNPESRTSALTLTVKPYASTDISVSASPDYSANLNTGDHDYKTTDVVRFAVSNPNFTIVKTLYEIPSGSANTAGASIDEYGRLTAARAGICSVKVTSYLVNQVKNVTVENINFIDSPVLDFSYSGNSPVTEITGGLSSGPAAANYTFAITRGSAYGSVDSSGRFTPKYDKVNREVEVTAEATIADGVYKGAKLSKTVTVPVNAPAKPEITSFSYVGYSPSVSVTGVSSGGYSVTYRIEGGGAYASILQDGTLTPKNTTTGGTVLVRATVTVTDTANVYRGESYTAFASVEIVAETAPSFTARINGSAVEISSLDSRFDANTASYSASPAGYVSVDGGTINIIKKDRVPVDVTVSVSYTVNSHLSAYNGRTVTVVAGKYTVDAAARPVLTSFSYNGNTPQLVVNAAGAAYSAAYSLVSGGDVVSINPVTGALSPVTGTGTIIVRVDVTLTSGAFTGDVLTSFAVIEPPVISSFSYSGASPSLSVTKGGEEYTDFTAAYSVVSGAAYLTVNASTGEILAATEAKTAIIRVVVTVTDGAFAGAELSSYATVTAPEISSFSYSGKTPSLSVLLSGAEFTGYTAEYSLAAGGDGSAASINSSTGLLTVNSVSSITVDVRVRITSGAFNGAELTARVTVNPPEITESNITYDKTDGGLLTVTLDSAEFGGITATAEAGCSLADNGGGIYTVTFNKTSEAQTGRILITATVADAGSAFFGLTVHAYVTFDVPAEVSPAV